MREKYLPYLFLAPAVLVLLAVVIFPLLYSLRLSFTNFSFGMPHVTFIGLRNFGKAFKDPNFWNGLRLTVTFVLGSTMISFVVGFALALLMNRAFLFRGLIRTLTLMPMTISPVVVGIIWMLLFMPDYSFINFLLGLTGIQGPQWLLNPNWALLVIILAYIWQWTPFYMLMLLAGLMALPVEPYEAALVDGASWWQSFRFITLPLLSPVIALTLAIRVMDAFKVFDYVFVMTEGGPGVSTAVLSFFIYREGIPYRHLGYASALSYIMVFILTVLILLTIRFLRQTR